MKGGTRKLSSSRFSRIQGDISMTYPGARPTNPENDPFGSKINIAMKLTTRENMRFMTIGITMEWTMGKGQHQASQKRYVL
jgi:hypothetical protein